VHDLTAHSYFFLIVLISRTRIILAQLPASPHLCFSYPAINSRAGYTGAPKKIRQEKIILITMLVSAVRQEDTMPVMHRSNSRNLIIAVSLLVLCACDAQHNTAYEFQSIDSTVSSRGVAVPVTYVHPLMAEGESFPLVVMLHGHGGTRNEAGGYTRVAEGLATRGIASIRMDFPGCGDSAESFVNNNLSNMLLDIQASGDYARSQPQVDSNRVGLLGYSMGGRLALLHASSEGSYKAIAAWTPEARDGADNMISFVGGTEAWKALKTSAAREGFALFTTRWGQDQKLGVKFFTDMEESRPLDVVGNIKVPLLVLYGDLDDVVHPRVSESVIAGAINSPEVVRHIVKGADHGLGLYSDEFSLSEDAVQTTVEFLSQRL